MPFSNLKYFMALVVFALALQPNSAALAAANIDIANTPMNTQLEAAPANIMFVLDDSGSMDWEFMTDHEDGIWLAGGTDHGLGCVDGDLLGQAARLPGLAER